MFATNYTKFLIYQGINKQKKKTLNEERLTLNNAE